MIDGASVLALITARGGSKGLTGKNLRPLGGRPLIVWSVEAVHGSTLVDRTVLSTESEEIAAVAAAAGCEVPFMRPAELATDEAEHLDVIVHALTTLDRTYDYVVLLQPTSPLRTAADIDNALRFCAARGAPACVSVCPVAKPPEWCYRLDGDDRLLPVAGSFERITQRQGLKPSYALDGALFIARCDWLLAGRDFISAETVAYRMPAERAVDIDTALDLAQAEFLLQHAAD